MTDNVNFSGSIERALKGDADPINLFGLSPSRAELRDNRADRARRATQIEFEQTSEGLKKGGGSIDPATKQVRKLKESATGSIALSPLSPFSGPGARTTVLLHDVARQKRQDTRSKRQLRAKNEEHRKTALTVENIADRQQIEPASPTSTRFATRRIRRTILGGAR